MTFQIGDYITVVKGTTRVTGQCMGMKIDHDGHAVELHIDGFYSSFELGKDDRNWRVEDVDEIV